MEQYLGQKVEVVVDRPLGSTHPKHKSIVYPINYGFVQGIIAGDGEEQDAYILGSDIPLERFVGRVIAIIKRKNDNENKWVVAPEGKFFSASEIEASVNFQEQYFEHDIVIVKDEQY